jgi:hypothetical protein
MLTIENFEKDIHGVSLNKGIKYYQSGAVTHIEEIGGNTWLLNKVLKQKV